MTGEPHRWWIDLLLMILAVAAILVVVAIAHFITVFWLS